MSVVGFDLGNESCIVGVARQRGIDVVLNEEAFVDAATEEGGESKLSALLFDVSQQVQESLQSMLKMTGDIEQCGGEIEAEIEQAKEGVADKCRVLEEEKERFQKVALAALNILSGGI